MKKIHLWFQNKTKNIIKKSNENWFSFLSGVCANIPVTLFLMFEKVNNTVVGWFYFGIFVLAFITAIIFMLFEFRFTIKVIEIKGKAKDKYDQYLRSINLGTADDPNFYEDPNMHKIMLEDECDNKLNELTKIAEIVVVLFGLLFLMVIALWVLKNFI